MTDVNLEIKSTSEKIFVLNRSKQYKYISEKRVKKKIKGDKNLFFPTVTNRVTFF